jgi:tripartite-type tricarboxylate transporter receptor subunit TctC
MTHLHGQRLAIAAALLLAHTATAQAQAPAAGGAYPTRAVRVMVGFAPGGGVDVMARIYAQKFSEALGQTFIVDNRPGATGNIATDLVAKAAPDGYTLLMTSTVHSINPSMFSKLPFDPLRDFAPISAVGSSPDCIAVHPSLPTPNLASFVALARARPDSISYASAGSGTVMHVGMELFRAMANIKLLHIPYNGSGPSTLAVIGGQVPVISTSLGTALPHARSGKLRMLAVTSAQRSPMAPEYPTAAEAANLPGYEAITWIGLLAPAGTPPAIVNRLNAEIERLSQVREVREQMAGVAFDPYRQSAAAFADLIRSDLVKWGKVVRDSGARAD